MKKTALFSIICLILAAQARQGFAANTAAAPALRAASGWLESAYVTWEAVADADGYNVYYSGEGITDKKIDAQLIRSYGAYYRADVPGLAAGSYTLKVVPVFAGTEGTGSLTTSTLTALPHDRSGFAFSPKSPKGTSSGAYNDNGTLRAGAQVLYLTAQTAKTLTLSVVTNNKNGTTACTGIGAVLAARQKGYDKTPLAIRIVGKVTATDMAGQINSLSLMEMKGKSSHTEVNVTIEGVGSDATAFGWGILLRNCVNAEVRNIAFMQFPDDGVSLDTDNRNIWVHNNDFFYGKNGGGDKNKGDGSLDSKKSGYATFSYNHFWDAGKCNLLGNGTETPEYLTYHHNWYDHSDSRHPRVRFHTVHVYNNYYDGNSKYGIGAAKGGPSIFAEANYFRKCKYPMLISMQGSDVAGGNTGTFSSEDGGIIKAYNNHIEGATRFVPYNAANPTTDFDAVVVDNRNDQIGADVKTLKGGNTYNNFDTDPGIMYAYTPDSPEEAKAKVMQYAGRVEGGDLKYTFSAADDASSDIIAALETAVKNYTPQVQEIQGGSSGNGEEGAGGNDEGGNDNGGGNDGGDNGSGGDNGNSGGGSVTVAGSLCDLMKSSSMFTISGNTSTSKGSATVGGDTYTCCLKMESATSISFTISSPMTLTLVFAGGESGKKVKIDGTNYTTDAQGRVTVQLEAGAHEITKGDSINLFYISLEGEGGGNEGSSGGDDDDDDDDEPVPANYPTLTITSPANNAELDEPATVTLAATASDSDGSIAKVEFYNGATLVETFTAPPYTKTFANLHENTYTFTVKAYDNDGNVTEKEVDVTVNAVVLPGDDFLGGDTPDGYFWFNEANAEKVNEMLADGTILGDSITFDPAKVITFDGQQEQYPAGVITVKKNGCDIIFHLPSCSEFKAYLTRTGGFSGDVLVSSNGLSWAKVQTLSGAKGKLELVLTEAAASASDVYIKIVNASTGGLNLHGVKITLAAAPAEPGEQPEQPGEQPGEPGDQPSEPGGQQPGEQQPGDETSGDNTTSVEQASATGVTIYPNPAKSTLYIVNSGSYTSAQILSVSGSPLYAHPIAAGSNLVDVSFLKAGVYFVRLAGPQGKVGTVKVLIK
jgi:pectate lyase